MIFTLLLSCGKASKSNSYPEQQEEISDGVYAAVLYPVNPSLTKDLQGGIKIHKFGDDFKVKVKLKDAPKGTQEQYLYSGSLCPTSYNDLSGDGIIDASEARAVMGEVILPFDGDLSSVLGGGGLFPVDSYEYTQSTSFSLMLSDLEHSQSILKLEYRAVLILKDGSMPLACGVLTKISDLPDIEKPPSPSPDRDRYRPKPPSRPKPPPPPPTVEPDPGSSQDSWWENMRNRWRRWRDSVREWWRSLSS